MLGVLLGMVWNFTVYSRIIWRKVAITYGYVVAAIPAVVAQQTWSAQWRWLGVVVATLVVLATAWHSCVPRSNSWLTKRCHHCAGNSAGNFTLIGPATSVGSMFWVLVLLLYGALVVVGRV